MTCVVGIKNEQGIYLGADRAASNGWGNTWTITRPKIFQVGPCTFGFAGDFRAAQLLQYTLKLPKLNQEPFKWCVTTLAPNIQECFDYHGYDNCEEGTDFIVAVKDHLFYLSEDFSLLETDRNYLSIGDGAQFADGVFAALGTQDAESVIETALRAAELNCGSVLSPFDIVKHE